MPLLVCASLGCSEIAGVRTLHESPADAAMEASAEAGACVDTQQDPRNCGVCGHDCSPGGCRAGRCTAGVLATVPDTGAVSLAVDGTRVFAGVVNGQLLAVPVEGGALTSLALPPSLRSIAVDALDLFLAADTTVLRCAAKSCGLPLTIADKVGAPAAVATTGDDVYFLDDTRLLRAPRAGGTTSVAAAVRPVAYVARPDGLTFTRTDGVYRCPAGGCGATAPARIADATAAGALAVDEGDVLWLDGNAVRRAAIPVPPSMATVEDLATTGPGAGSLVVTAKRVYWREAGVRVAGCPRQGGAAETLADAADAPATDLVADTTSLYWMTANRRIMRLVR